MTFRPKRIFLADDNQEWRESVKKVLVEAGHEIVLEASRGDEAMEMANKAVDLGIEVLVTDKHMPNSTDGEKLASTLNESIKSLLIVSISSDPFLGIWPDPNFDPTKPYSKDFQDFDINARERNKGADLTAYRVNWDLKELARQIGELEFSLTSQSGLETIQKFSRYKEVK